MRGMGETISFRVTDGGASIPVVYTGVLPDLFNEGEGMVGTGSLKDGVFEATAEVIDALKEQGVYQDPVEAPNG